MNKHKKYIAILFLIIIGGWLSVQTFTLAKYVSTGVWDYYLKSKGFYFTSDHLGTIEVENIDTLWDGGSVNFNIKNNLNQDVISTYDISYKVVCTVKGDAATHTECHLNGTAQSTQNAVLSSFQNCSNTTGDGIDTSGYEKMNCELSGYVWLNQIAVKDLYFDIIVTDEEYELSDINVNITVTSTTPYRKVISGDFKLHPAKVDEETVAINYRNYSTYDKLIVSNTYTENKCVKVFWDGNKISIEADESEFMSYATNAEGYINEVAFEINAKDSLNYIFHKKNVENTYNVSEFTIVEMDDCGL